MVKKAFITGIAGSTGSFLAEYLLKQNLEVHGISRWHSTSANNKNLKNATKDIRMFECDLNDLSAVVRTLKESKPDYIFHLAAHANVKVCFSNPLAVMQNNVMGTMNLFEAVRLLELDPIVQHCSTSEVYGNVKREETPIKETHPLNPANIYAVSKLAQEKIAQSYFYSYNMKTVITRMFAYLNPRREDIFSSAFAKQIVRIERGQQKEIVHGNLESVRTLIDIRDAVESYWVASNNCNYGEPYNIGGNTIMSVGDFLQKIKNCSIEKNIESRCDESLLRPIDVTMQIPDISKFFNKTMWEPKYTFEESMEMLMEHYRGRP